MEERQEQDQNCIQTAVSGDSGINFTLQKQTIFSCVSEFLVVLF